jgi:broad specificity phosphatase PhoE
VTTTFFLVRHATHDRLGRILCGRMPGVSLGENGHREAARLARHFSGSGIVAIRTSPLERARETAEPIAARCDLVAEACAEITEIDFGTWTGQSFENLSSDPDWARWNQSRSTSRPPAGETMQEAQARMCSAMEKLHRLHGEASVALVSHGDVIKAAILHHLGLSVDHYGRFDIDPASVSTLVVGSWGSRLLRLNEAVP